MPPKRKLRGSSPANKGLAPGQVLKRSSLSGNTSSPWAWVGSEAKDPSQITQEHRMMACGLSSRNRHTFCRNRFKPKTKGKEKSTAKEISSDEDLIIIADDDEPRCERKHCKSNPNCLNYVNTSCWLDEDDAQTAFMKAVNLDDDPHYDSREPDLPAGLKNLGATCYANASLQVWFRDPAFRNGVYKCRPAVGAEERFKNSPLYQLQVTFAALQDGYQNVFNPVRLVESLKLRTSEQQDAQEFSKLFMSHLDAEFKKQTSPELRSLVEDQFQGKQVYGTRCDTCGFQSEKSTGFLEIEINFKNKAKLEECILASLQEEKLTDDNKYLCPHCDGHQDATRYTELRELPPVLHFSLLRFVYDFETMERKKSKNIISFPLQLDMARFIGGRDIHDQTNHQYELRGVLLHKGASAHHGHYEAQVYDTRTKSWYQFNDELVTKIKKLGKPLPATVKEIIDIDDEDEAAKPRSTQRPKKTGKRRRVDDSEDESEKTTPERSSKPETPIKSTPSNEITSKDAYMLIYTRKDVPISQEADTKPSEDVLQVVKSLNNKFAAKCEAFAKKHNAATAFIAEKRRKIEEIIFSWNVSSVIEDSRIVSKTGLESWLSKHAMNDAVRTYSHQTRPDTETEITLGAIICEHGQLDPKEAEQMKRVSAATLHQIKSETHCVFDKEFSPQDVCHVCVEDCFKEELYDLQHPQDVNRFTSFENEDASSCGYWISKSWIKDWRLSKPKMHIWSQGDPPPDDTEFREHVRCEHGDLSLKNTSRRLISVQSCEVLTDIFPSWHPLSSDAKPCDICSAILKSNIPGKFERRKAAENEKAKLKNLIAGDPPPPVVGGLLALVPSDFLKAWRSWIHRPTDLARPDRIETETFLCEHEQLAFDPNCAMDMNYSVTLISELEWVELISCYAVGPAVMICRQEDATFTHEIPVCRPCRHKRKHDWETTDICIQFGRKGSDKASIATATSVMTRKAGARQSKRLRQAREYGERRRITVSKTTTVKEIKQMVEQEFQMSVMLQRLFYAGTELDDNAATVSSLCILANDILDLEEHREVWELSDTEDGPKKRRRNEGNAFGGTLLGSGETFVSSDGSDGDTDLAAVLESSVKTKSCGACTLDNPTEATECSMCSTSF